MGLKPTKEILDEYYASIAGTPAEKTRARIDRPELYAYEMKIGKELIDMEVDDLYGLFFELFNKRKGKMIQHTVSHSSYDQLSTLLRAIFNFYIDNIQPIRNPLNDKRMKGREAVQRLAQGKEPFRWETIENIIKKLHKEFDEDRIDYADYIELIILLYYNGFRKAEEIIEIEADMINHHSKTVKLPSRNVPIRLSDRCYELLVKFNTLDSIVGWRGEYLLVSWNGSYFKFTSRASQVEKLVNRPMSEMCSRINNYINKDVNDKFGVQFSYRTLYLLGFYEYIVGKHGYEKTNEMITSYRDSESVAELMSLAKEYEVPVDNISHLKRYLRPFIISN